MSAEDFFSRWSRKKREAAQDESLSEQAPARPADAEAAAGAALQPELPPPTMDDVDKLDRDSDFSRFMRRDVDESVKRSAMKKLFADPHFNVMDGLDIYIDDYNKFEPLPAAMVALLEHAKPILNPPADLRQSAMAMLDAPGETLEPAPQPNAAEASQAAEELAADEAKGGKASFAVQEPEAQASADEQPQDQEQADAMDRVQPDAQHNAAQAANQSPAAPEDGNPIQSL
ncbi:DUF3306 domain-containing protein [Noviherbaspirillum pedocola]|uniref:DUF3306 domain-containing protein n=1 Tax=Noviherbaspirillum pedocola TaxID=2801341 RepID=A0A934SZB4_9BURK|nr:DUF3306 domain-containing protein [Noviherbaspirillum pedocola]MBK4734498.1 DUF3306 domain-containing protein [Noviherbaspirillum pedocola]